MCDATTFGIIDTGDETTNFAVAARVHSRAESILYYSALFCRLILSVLHQLFRFSIFQILRFLWVFIVSSPISVGVGSIRLFWCTVSTSVIASTSTSIATVAPALVIASQFASAPAICTALAVLSFAHAFFFGSCSYSWVLRWWFVHYMNRTVIFNDNNAKWRCFWIVIQ